VFPNFTLKSDILDKQRIAIGHGIRDRLRLQRVYGGNRWRKMKGKAWIVLADGTEHYVELHWYECHGIGMREIKIKRVL
jgi:hypothetical protein